MDKYTYCIANSWASSNTNQRHVYVRFSEKLSFTQVESFTKILQNIRSENKNNPEHTSWDIVIDALEEFKLKWGIYGVIVDSCSGLIMY